MNKILYICPSSGIGGAETFLLQTLSHGDSNTCENHYLLFQTGPLLDQLQNLGANVHILNSPPRLSKFSDRKKVSQKIKTIINENNIDLVHSTMAYAALFSAKTCKQMKVPHVWFQHGPASGWMDRLAAVLYHNGLIVNSHYTGKTQRRLENPLRFLIPRKNPIEKILLGTPEKEHSTGTIETERNKLFQNHNISGTPVIVGMLCRIQEWKGIHVFLDSLTLLKQDTTLPPIHGIIWGEAFKDNTYLNELKSQVKKEKLPVAFAGRSNNSSLSLSCCDIMVNASIQPEPFGLSIVEAMMVGTIPIVPDEGGPMEIVNQGKDGLIFKARNPTSLANQISILVKNKDLLSSLSEQAKIMARKKYNSSRVISHLEKFHQKVLAQGNR